MESVATLPQLSHNDTLNLPSKSQTASLGSPSPTLVSVHEEMNPAKRCSMEDCCVYSAPGTWDAPDPDMAFLGVYDGHGGESALLVVVWRVKRTTPNSHCTLRRS
jgi:hypothetical protein